jgi:hypothetical protein
MILGINIDFGYARGRTRMIRRCAPGILDQLYPAELFQNNTTPVFRRTNWLESAPAVATVLVAQNAKPPIPIPAEPMWTE